MFDFMYHIDSEYIVVAMRVYTQNLKLQFAPNLNQVMYSQSHFCGNVPQAI